VLYAAVGHYHWCSHRSRRESRRWAHRLGVCTTTNHSLRMNLEIGPLCTLHTQAVALVVDPPMLDVGRRSPSGGSWKFAFRVCCQSDPVTRWVSLNACLSAPPLLRTLRWRESCNRTPANLLNPRAFVQRPSGEPPVTAAGAAASLLRCGRYTGTSGNCASTATETSLAQSAVETVDERNPSVPNSATLRSSRCWPRQSRECNQPGLVDAEGRLRFDR
jgi:hypothetical protein